MNNWRLLLNEPTLELILIYQNEEEKVESKKDSAFIVLCYRFRKDVLEKCEILCKRFKHSCNVAEIITEATFEKYGRKPNFQIEKSNTSNIENAFKFYLFGIAGRELTNYFRKEQKRKKGYDYNGTESIITELPPIPFEKLDTKTRVKHKAILSLPQSHITVYLTYEYYERKGFNLPKKLLIELREHLGVKQTTIRTYKKEAKDRIQSYLDAMAITQKFNNQ